MLHRRFSEGELVIKELPSGSTSVHGIRALLSILRNHEKFEPDLIIVDYIGYPKRFTHGNIKRGKNVFEALFIIFSIIKLIFDTL